MSGNTAQTLIPAEFLYLYLEMFKLKLGGVNGYEKDVIRYSSHFMYNFWLDYN